MKIRSIVISLTIVVGLIWAIVTFPTSYGSLITTNYYVDLLCFTATIVLMIRYSSINGFRIFDPMWTFSFMYIMMYFITPMYDLYIGKHTWYGYSLQQYAVKASIIALLGYISFYVIYTVRFKLHNTAFCKGYYTQTDYEMSLKREVSVFFILVMYVVCFFANAFYMIKYYGMSIQALLSFGMIKGADISATSAEIGFISMLSYSLPTVTLLYLEYGNSKALKIILFIPMFVMQVTRGFRFFVIQIVLTFVSYYYVRTKKKPSLISLASAFAILMVFILGMTMFREAMRWGGNVDIASVSSTKIQEAFDDAIWDNFRIYNNYYGIVGAIPERYGYVYGREIIIGTIVMMIPRILWPGKISSSANAGLKNIIGSNIASGQASPNISEFYYSCGAFGVVFFMGIFSAIMKVAKRKMDSQDPLDIMTFSVLLGSNIQLIIRSYTPSNFWYVVFALLPIWIVKKTSRVVWNEQKDHI